MNDKERAAHLRELLRRELSPERYADVLELVRLVTEQTSDEAYQARERTIDAMAAHLPAAREIAEHVFQVESGGEAPCPSCDQEDVNAVA